ncbi:MAG: methyltransferase domain-containing protein [Acidobacteriota bacterium]|jgi:2-polyprenyl-3-methyl-5-hydroxy-6-metoxy-1,4-benzoquinol methylase
MASWVVGVANARPSSFAALADRHLVPERMDDPALPAAEHRHALAGLARINFLSAAAGSFRTPLRRLCELDPRRAVRVLDVATGGGDVPVRLACWARRRDLPLHFTGCDVSPGAIALASARAERRSVQVGFFCHDVLRDGVPGGFDAIISSLFLHHLPTPLAREVLAAMAGAARLVVVNDLVRSPTAYTLAWAGTRVLSRSPVVRFDGPASVRAAFTLPEARALAEAAGLTGATIRWRWPFRFLLTWWRP